ncbi:MAG: hypothetical protein V4501_00175 [Pseudomonadota bacterium]
MKTFLTLTFTLILCVPNFANAFNNASFKGSYAFGLFGPSGMVLASESQTVATGIVVADGRGHVTGHGNFRSAGSTCTGTFTGKYNINVDGTGSLSSNINTSTPGCIPSVLDLAMVLANNGESFDVASVENDYLAGTFIKQNQVNFKLSDLKGGYGLRLSGTSTIIGNDKTTVGVIRIIADGAGKITGTGTLRSDGVTCPGSLLGNYAIHQDGAGSINTNFTTSTPGCRNTVVDLGIALFNKSNGALIANTENDYMTGALHKQ